VQESAPGADKALAADAKAAVPEAKKEEVAKEPDAKKPKLNPPAAATVRKQVEYYLSDDNLRTDKFFSEKIRSTEEGWLDMSLILSCNKMKAMRATLDDVVAALKDSKIEMKEGNTAVRRPGNAPLPKLEEKPQHHHKKNTLHVHEGGVVVVVKGVPAEQSWLQVKEKLKEKLPEKVVPWFVSEVNEKAQCSIVCPPFQGDIAFFESCTVELGGATLRTEICYGEALQQVQKTLPKHIREKREREAKRKQKERNKPILIGDQKFLSVGALRGKVKEIMNSRSDGERLKPEGTDFKLLKALLAFHPKGEEKTKGMVGIMVDKAKKGEGSNRCFHMVLEDDSVEDISVMKCINAVEANPPFVTIEKKAEKKPEEKKAAEVKKEEAKTADVPMTVAEDKAEDKTAEAKTEVKPEAEPAKAEENTATAEPTEAQNEAKSQ